MSALELVLQHAHWCFDSAVRYRSEMSALPVDDSRRNFYERHILFLLHCADRMSCFIKGVCA